MTIGARSASLPIPISEPALAARYDHRPLDEIFQFTDIARPFPGRQPFMTAGEIDSIFFCICFANFCTK